MNIKNILWDFDGVIIDSMPIRDYGFRKIFDKYNEKLVEELILYHRLNGGLSRFNKIKYFYNNILNKEISEETIQKYAKEFTSIMKKELTNEKYLIKDSINFIKENYKKYNFHIVSGSENNELNFLCKELSINRFFLTINGSPTTKEVLVKNVILDNNYIKKETILIGDSINDYESAKINDIMFYGYNNKKLLSLSKNYLHSFKDI